MANDNSFKKETEDNTSTKIREKSQYLGVVSNFAEYIQKEYVKPSDGDMALLVCAIDNTLDERSCPSTCVALGNKELLAFSLSSFMDNPNIKEVIDTARSVNFEEQLIKDNIKSLKRRLYTCYISYAIIAFWSLLVAYMICAEIGHWYVHISCLLLNAISFFSLYNQSSDVRRRMRLVKEEGARIHAERLERSMKAFFSFLKDAMKHREEDVGDDDE